VVEQCYGTRYQSGLLSSTDVKSGCFTACVVFLILFFFVVSREPPGIGPFVHGIKQEKSPFIVYRIGRLKLRTRSQFIQESSCIPTFNLGRPYNTHTHACMHTHTFTPYSEARDPCASASTAAIITLPFMALATCRHHEAGCRGQEHVQSAVDSMYEVAAHMAFQGTRNSTV
jgi:hypothetical protein